jgi:hypothetical protein
MVKERTQAGEGHIIANVEHEGIRLLALNMDRRRCVSCAERMMRRQSTRRLKLHRLVSQEKRRLLATNTQGAIVFPDITLGIIEASATGTPLIPCT